ncbi:Protease inhibitor Inh [Pseudovibrio denitrificans]|uniref:Protease inhibitor Inh n=2 Tax=Pseudovibrio denitrificans TaxID=258256 RepID=A0A1I7DN10_9HYPH|nr:Protease inhibitor Inh [Pseudovibrio denitrificans]
MRGILRKTVVMAGATLAFAGLGVLSSQASVISGHWSISDALSSKTCSAQLETEPAASGYGNTFKTTNCQGLYAPISKATAWQWSYEEGLSLLDADGQVVLQFDIDELDGLTSVGPSSLFLIMQPVYHDSKVSDLSELIEKAIVVTAQR